MTKKRVEESRHIRFRIWRVLFVVIVVSMVLMMVPTAGAASIHGPSPPDTDIPTEVYLSFLLLDIPEINVRTESYQVEGLLYAGWYDKRLAFTSDDEDDFELGRDEDAIEEQDASLAEGRQLSAGDIRSQIEPNFVTDGVKSYGGASAMRVLRDEIWSPQFEISNSRGEPFRNIYTTLRVYEDGFVEYEERFNATLAARMDLAKFPLDNQVLPIVITTFDYDSRQLVFKQVRTNAIPEFRLSEWDVLNISGSTTTETAYGIEPQDPDTAFYYPVAELEIKVSRKSGYYFLRIIVPLMLIIFLSWSVFWLESGSISDQLSVSFMVLLTVVAFNFLVAEKLPPIAYITFMDVLILTSYVFVAFSIAQNLIQASLYRMGREEASRRVDIVSRWLFPVTYVSVIALEVLLYFEWPL